MKSEVTLETFVIVDWKTFQRLKIWVVLLKDLKSEGKFNFKSEISSSDGTFENAILNPLTDFSKDV